MTVIAPRPGLASLIATPRFHRAAEDDPDVTPDQPGANAQADVDHVFQCCGIIDMIYLPRFC
jgi:hypothetical protein